MPIRVHSGYAAQQILANGLNPPLAAAYMATHIMQGQGDSLRSTG